MLTRVKLIACAGTCGKVLQVESESLDISDREMENAAHKEGWRAENYWEGGPKPKRRFICMRCIIERFIRRFKKGYKEDVRLLG